MSNILLVGAGYLGQDLMFNLSNQKHNITILDKNSKPAYLNQNIVWHTVNISDGLNFDDFLDGQDVLVNFLPSITNEKSFGIDLGVNIQLVEEMVKSASRQGVKKIIFASSAAVYGEMNHKRAVESSVLVPINNYGFSKFVLERAHSYFCEQYKINLTIARISNPFGFSLKNKKSKSFFDFLREAVVDNKPIPLVAGGSVYRDFIFIKDLTSALVKLIETDNLIPVINLGSGRAHSLIEVVNYANNFFNTPIKIDAMNKPFDVIEYSCFDVGYYEKVFGRMEKNNFFENLNEYFKSF